MIRLTFEDVLLFEYDDNIADKVFSDEIGSEVRSGKLDEEGNF